MKLGTSRFRQVLFFALAFALVGCSAAASGEREGESSSAILSEYDCSAALGLCYRACQGVQPTPDAECFDQCGCNFSACVGAPQPECEPDENPSR